MKTKLILTGLALLLMSGAGFANYGDGNGVTDLHHGDAKGQPVTQEQATLRINANGAAWRTCSTLFGLDAVPAKKKASKAGFQECVAAELEKSGAFPSGTRIRLKDHGQCLVADFPARGGELPYTISCSNYMIPGANAGAYSCIPNNSL
ncbi:MAG: hypothetical protein JSS53_03560 [Proteobacteria bacterium]|nr:hypothetical protein [Pseudomonadota bacterium]